MVNSMRWRSSMRLRIADEQSDLRAELMDALFQAGVEHADDDGGAPARKRVPTRLSTGISTPTPIRNATPVDHSGATPPACLPGATPPPARRRTTTALHASQEISA